MSDRRQQGAEDDERHQGPEKIYAFADRLQQGVEEREEEREQLETWVCFAVSEQALALPVGDVREVVRVGAMTRVPGAPAAVRGATSYRDRVLPLVDLGVRFGLEALEVGEASRVVVVAARGRLIGLLVDRALRVVQLAPSTFRPPQAELDRALKSCAAARTEDRGEPLLLLDTERLLALDDAAASPPGDKGD